MAGAASPPQTPPMAPITQLLKFQKLLGISEVAPLAPFWGVRGGDSPGTGFWDPLPPWRRLWCTLGARRPRYQEPAYMYTYTMYSG